MFRFILQIISNSLDMNMSISKRLWTNQIAWNTNVVTFVYDVIY